jgi:hypothetical protein
VMNTLCTLDLLAHGSTASGLNRLLTPPQLADHALHAQIRRQQVHRETSILQDEGIGAKRTDAHAALCNCCACGCGAAA